MYCTVLHTLAVTKWLIIKLTDALKDIKQLQK